MQTARDAVFDGNSPRLSNDTLGLLHRRVDEIKRRINEGTLEKQEVLGALQRIIESKFDSIGPCKRRHRSEPLIFKRTLVSQRRKSIAPLRQRLPQQLNRLFFFYKHKLQTGMWGSPSGRKLHPEDIMAMMWEAENIPDPVLNFGRVPIQGILDSLDPTEREVAIVASTLQWLGTNIGSEFLVRFIRTADIPI